MKKVWTKASNLARLCVELSEDKYQLLKKLIGLNRTHIVGHDLCSKRKGKEVEVCLTTNVLLYPDFSFVLSVSINHFSSLEPVYSFSRLDSENFLECIFRLHTISMFLGTALENCRVLEMEKCPVCNELVYENKKK